jgi:hypothetical protein
LATGQIALWCVFWLIGTPLSLVWDVSGGCMVVGCGVQEPLIVGFLIVLFTLSSIALVFVSLAIAAKLCAAFSALVTTLSFLAVLYFSFDFIYAAF